MAKHGENIRKRKDGRWEGRYPKGKKGGKPIFGSVFGKTYQEAKENLIVAKAALTNTLKAVPEHDIVAGHEIFRSSAEEWLEAAKPTLKESTISRYRTALDRHLFPEFGDKEVTEIVRDDISAFSSRLLASQNEGGKGLAPKTVSAILSVMKNVMNYIRLVKGWTVISFDGLAVKIPQKQLRVFSVYEQEMLNVCLLDDLTPSNMGILLCLYTGLRIGELCALKWGDISFVEQKLRVERTMQRIQKPDEDGHKTQIVITPPKSDCSVRDIPIPDNLFQILMANRQPDGCFFLTGREKIYIEPRTMENRFNKVTDACGISGATVHTCRHSFATRAVELGFDIKTLSEILGHASVTITMNRYVHPSMQLKQQNMNKLCSLLGGKIGVAKKGESN